MSYLVLARKWRPQSFRDVVGQEAVVRILQNALRRDRVAHAMIYSGVRGVGKTTLARIMAKALNCEGQGDDPCNECDSCRAMTAGSAVDLKEIDGASNRGIQEIRELKENIRFFPVSSRYKIVIIDEVHMLTTEAFNALLKTLEEPPEHVYFMFATTELHKVPITILSRCQRYELKRVGLSSLGEFFAHIASHEQIAISASALDMIAREADGSVRDGLSLLDQMFSFAAETADGSVAVLDEDVVQVLGLVESAAFVALARAVFASDLASCLDVLELTYQQGVDLQRFAADLLEFFRGMMICKSTSQPASLLDISADELASMQELVEEQSKETLYQLFHIFLQGMEDMHFSRQPRLALEMVFVRAIQVGQISPAAELAGRLSTLIEKSGGAIAPPTQGTVAAPPQPPRPPMPPVSQPPPSEPTGSDTVQAKPPLPTLERLPEKSVARPTAEPLPKPSKPAAVASKPPIPASSEESVVSPPSPSESAAPEVEVVVASSKRDVSRDWQGFVGYVKERQAWMAQVLRLCEAPHIEDGKLIVRYENPADCLVLSQPEKIQALTTYAQDFFQTELSLDICSMDFHQKEGDGPTPRDDRRALGNDPLVKMVAEVFDGQVIGIRTGPKFR